MKTVFASLSLLLFTSSAFATSLPYPEWLDTVENIVVYTLPNSENRTIVVLTEKNSAGEGSHCYSFYLKTQDGLPESDKQLRGLIFNQYSVWKEGKGRIQENTQGTVQRTSSWGLGYRNSLEARESNGGDAVTNPHKCQVQANNLWSKLNSSTVRVRYTYPSNPKGSEPKFMVEARKAAGETNHGSISSQLLDTSSGKKAGSALP